MSFLQYAFHFRFITLKRPKVPIIQVFIMPKTLAIRLLLLSLPLHLSHKRQQPFNTQHCRQMQRYIYIYNSIATIYITYIIICTSTEFTNWIKPCIRRVRIILWLFSKYNKYLGSYIWRPTPLPVSISNCIWWWWWCCTISSSTIDTIWTGYSHTIYSRTWTTVKWTLSTVTYHTDCSTWLSCGWWKQWWWCGGAFTTNTCCTFGGCNYIVSFEWHCSNNGNGKGITMRNTLENVGNHFENFKKKTMGFYFHMWIFEEITPISLV